MEDQKIIELFFSRSEHAIEQLEEKYGKLLYQIAFRILGNEEDAKECVNDTYLGIWNAIPPEKPDLLRPYLCRITRNLALKRCSKNNAAKRSGNYDVALEELADCLPDRRQQTEEALLAKELGSLINSFLAMQDQENRSLFIRRYFLAESVEDLAAHFGMRPNTVSVRLGRMRKSLRRFLRRNFYE